MSKYQHAQEIIRQRLYKEKLKRLERETRNYPLRAERALLSFLNFTAPETTQEKRSN